MLVWIFSVIACLLLLCIVMLCSNIRVNIHLSIGEMHVFFDHSNVNKDLLRLEAIALFGLLRRQFSIPLDPSAPRNLYTRLDKRRNKGWSNFNRKLFRAMPKVRCDKLEWHTRIGLDNAATTAVATGMIWGLKSPIIGFLMHKMKLRFTTTPQCYVTPRYNEFHFTTHLACNLKIRLASLLATILRKE